jgi:shikimate kinase
MNTKMNSTSAYDTSLILIGMPGAGKSTIGLLLAKELAKGFIDTDLLIQIREGKTLQDIIEERDYLALRSVEEEILLSMVYPNHVIATGGSVVYSEAGMAHLKKFGRIVFLDVSSDELQRRIDNYASRGIARRPEQTFAELFVERQKLYQKYADIIINCENKSQTEIVREIICAEGAQYAEVDV